MRVIITGGSGLIGRSLVQLLATQGYEIIVLSRRPIQTTQMFSQQGLTNIKIIGWDARSAQGWGNLITSESAIVNLAGATPAHWHWTRSYRAHILESRLRAGEAIIQAMERYGPPKVLVQASASGYYGDRGQDLLTEACLPGQGFRAQVCQEWEASTALAQTRRCIARTGLVLDTHAGAFPPLLHFAQLLGRRLGDGRQWLPWIHKVDVARAIQFLLEQQSLSGPFNLCAPEAVTNRELLREVQHVLKRPSVLPLPAFALRILLGELSTVVLDSQHLLPQRLTEAQFQFAYPQLKQALHDLL
ncbi:TIGR01777 family oxidoreductase [Ktedonobacter robiniae]|uniref:Epimerase n=1 Tax=Ktedonobacter robiniae TaxID=2778365 RepID=A0ABQ3V6E8_9CHLR|nr:TIGR01777 family oxidoreductase [Ktedonobacter robiniae]GHO60200.1 epimerase [Ktedonobacter robiniae]